MSDNTQLNSGIGGDTVRDIDRNLNGVKTQVMQLDFAGPQSNSEQLASPLNGLPVVSPELAAMRALMTNQLMLAQVMSAQSGQFVPLEIPAFLGAF